MKNNMFNRGGSGKKKKKKKDSPRKLTNSMELSFLFLNTNVPLQRVFSHLRGWPLESIFDQFSYFALLLPLPHSYQTFTHRYIKFEKKIKKLLNFKTDKLKTRIIWLGWFFTLFLFVKRPFYPSHPSGRNTSKWETSLSNEIVFLGLLSKGSTKGMELNFMECIFKCALESLEI